jgi:uncharacterized membrane protein
MRMSFFSRIGNIIKRNFVSGLLVTVPLIVTYFVLRILFNAFDGLLSPIVYGLLGYEIPGLGAAVTILLILLAGIITTNFVGARLFHLSDSFLTRTPLVRIIYTAAKQLLESLLSPKARAFSEVALVEYPRRGIYAIGFLSGKSRLKSKEDGQERAVCAVFVPSTPTPFSGMTIYVPENEIYNIDISLEEAVKIIVSGGIVTPPAIDMDNNRDNREVTNAAG